ncbi:MAG: lysophospholipid acyltransferase family protein [Saprospiraceae bacterium]|nr:lysophospholipid acyltransferase family protein [Saprospiraceae bacterium]
MFGKILAVMRIVGVLLALAFYLGRLMLLSVMFGRKDERGFRFRRKFANAALRILGVRLIVRGTPATETALYVSNHRSLVDPLIELSLIDAFVVSKAEVSGYPLVGRGARETGVIFVQRQKTSSRAAARLAIRRALSDGKSVLIYPEGTTSKAETTQAFRLGSFQVAAELGVPVVPVAVDYADPGNYWFEMPMLPFFLRKFSKKRTRAAVSIGTPIVSADPLALAEQARDWIGHEIHLLRQTLRTG